MNTPNPTAQAVADYLTAQHIVCDVTGGQFTNRDGWECFAWQVSFARKLPGRTHDKPAVFDYFTGAGHIKPRSRAQQDPYSWQFRPGIPVRPMAADVLACLLMDAAAAHMGFSEWCSEYGYSDDSIKAFETYRACEQCAQKLAAVFTREQCDALRAMLQDY